MTPEYAKLVIDYLFSQRMRDVVSNAEESNRQECTCASRSWYGEGHDSACYADDTREDREVLLDFLQYVADQNQESA